MPHPAWRVALVVAALAATPLAEAATTAESQFRKGVAAFKAGDYGRAITRFEAAREAGLDSPALYHNLGVSYYRRGHYAKAAAAFRKLARDPRNRGLAHYNLGLVAQARDRPAQARDHFRTARSQARSADIRDLADRRLEGLPTADSRPPPLSLLASAGLGYDDNVTLVPDDIVGTSGTGDRFLHYLAVATAQVTGDRRHGFQIKGSLMGTDYAEIHRFDQTYLRGGVEWDRRWGEWDTDLAAYAGRIILGGEGFETIYTGEAAGYRDLAADIRLRLRYRLSRIEAEAPYAYLTGNRHRASVSGRYRNRGSARLGYELAYNDRRDRSTADSFASVSPTRHHLFAQGSYPVNGPWEAEAKAEYRFSHYPEANTDSETGLDRVRQDHRLRLRVTVSRELPWQLRGSASYERTDNRSNIAAYDYSANRYRLSVERFF